MDFFEQKQAAAIFKHAILDKYIHPFVGKTGRFSQDHRVAFIDGYAGEGRYVSGDEGSPSLLMRKARELRSMPRQLECYFVENKRTVYAKLQKVIAAEGAGLPVYPFRGKVSALLPDLLERASGIPLLLFLDPYGLVIPFDLAVTPLTSRGGSLPTELLINFNAVGLRRIAGHLTSPNSNEASLRSMDAVFGDSSWRQIWLDLAPNKSASQAHKFAAEQAVINAYARRFAVAAGCSSWTTEVRNRAHHMPVYYLVFLTRHPDGMDAFAEALSLGLAQWRKAVHMIVNAGTLFGDEAAFDESEAALAAGWVDEIEANLRAQLSLGQGFTIRDRYDRVFGTAIGQAREMHLRKAWKRLYDDKTTVIDSTGSKLIRKWIMPT